MPYCFQTRINPGTTHELSMSAQTKAHELSMPNMGMISSAINVNIFTSSLTINVHRNLSRLLWDMPLYLLQIRGG